MGFFYANIALRTTDSLSRAGCWAYVLPPSKGYIVVCEEQCDRLEVLAIQQLASRLSEDLDCLVFASLNFDDDILMYWLYGQGALLDTYRSEPYSPDDAPLPPGSPDVLSTHFGKAARASKIAKILNSQHTYAAEKHQALARVLGLPMPETMASFRDFREDVIFLPGQSVALVKQRLLRSIFDTSDIIKPFDLTREVKRLLRQGKKISAIELYMQHTQSRLIDARAYIESLQILPHEK